mgnify:CR=1 FL=1
MRDGSDACSCATYPDEALGGNRAGDADRELSSFFFLLLVLLLLLLDETLLLLLLAAEVLCLGAGAESEADERSLRSRSAALRSLARSRARSRARAVSRVPLPGRPNELFYRRVG